MTRLLFLTTGIVLLALGSNLHAQTLRAHWQLDDGVGTTATDSSGFGNSGTLLGGPNWVSGQLDGAVDFDGVDDRIAIPAGPFAFSSWNAITLSAWIQHEVGAESRTNDVVGQWNYPSSPSFILTHHRSNQYFFELAGIGFVTGGAVSADWTHVVATYDGLQMVLYVNGSSVATNPGVSGTLRNSTADVVIGSQADGSNHFRGIIDDVRIYQGALSALEVQALYDSAFDITPPSVPQNLGATSIGFTSVSLQWDAASDPESGIGSYRVYRDASFVEQTISTSYTDGGLVPSTPYTYTVEAVNGQGLVSAPSDPFDVSTTSDTAPPEILSISGEEFSVEVLFDEAVEALTAETAGNYTIPTITVLGASLAADDRTVTLTTSAHLEGPSYDLTVAGVEDLWGNSASGAFASYTPTFSDPSLRGHWKLDETSGLTALDSSDDLNDGVLINGPIWEDGLNGGGLRFDGINDSVRVDPSSLGMSSWSGFTVMAWVKNDVGAGALTDDIVSHWNYPSGPSWVLTHHRNNEYFFEISGKSWLSGGTVSTKWTHVTGTYDGSFMRLYVDGTEVDWVGGLSGTLPNTFADLVIGGQDNPSNFFDGLIDDARLYDRALSSSEVLDIYNETLSVIASASPSLGGAPLLVQFSAEDPGGDIASYAWDFGDGGTSTAQNPVYTYNDSGLFVATVVATHTGGGTSSDTVTIDVSTVPNPVVEFWYGPDQPFGTQGISQFFVNILGNASAASGLSSLTYSLNGAADAPLSIGPDDRRLALAGDFNLDLPLSSLQTGANQVVVTATALGGVSTSEALDFTYDPVGVWPLPFAVTWTDSTVISEAVQVVDGKWSASSSGARILEPEYDRILSVGDLLWTDYEITVPITINDYTPGDLGPESVSAGLGITFRWTGHTDNPVTCPQPSCGWLPSGAGAWYDIGAGGPLILDGNDDFSVSMDIGDTYVWKMRVQTIAGVGPLYSLRVWEQSTTEPSTWNLQSQRTFADEPNGSIVLNLHHVDATIGDIAIVDPNGPNVDPPAVVGASAPDATTVTVLFSEPVDPVTAETLANYLIDQGIGVVGAFLEANETTVTLTTTPHAAGNTYGLDIANVEDLAGNPLDPVFLQYTYTPLAAIADYPLDGPGLTAIDASGNGHDGALLGGATWITDGTRGPVVELDGFDDLIAVPSGPLSMDTWSELTVAAWVQNDIGPGAGTDDIVSWWEWTGYPCSNCSFVLTHHKNDLYRFEMGGSYVLGGAVGTGWTHVVATYDGGNLRLYVDGLEVDAVAYTGGIPFSTADLILGSQANDSNYFDGSLDDVILYDRALTPQQVLDLYSL